MTGREVAAVLGEAAVRWVEGVVGARVVAARGLLPTGSPWSLTLDRPAADVGVLAAAGPADPAGPGVAGEVVYRAEVIDQAAERAALRLAAEHGVRAPRLLGQHPELGSLITFVRGSTRIPVEPRVERFAALGALAARLHAVAVGPESGLAARARPIEDVDFAALRRAGDTTPLLDEGDAVLARLPRPAGAVFVHGDLWQGNVMWAGAASAEVAAVIDWDCAGHGHPGVDVGSLRMDVAVIFGLEHADAVDAGWSSVTGHAPPDRAYFDLVTALASPTDMGWFTTTINGQFDGVLDREVAVGRRDAFLRRALAELGA